MDKFIFTLVATAVFCGVSVSAACDNTTYSKIEQCALSSSLFKPNNLPKNQGEFTAFCSANATINCLATEMGNCVDNERQTDLINHLLNKERIVSSRIQMCENTTVLDASGTCIATNIGNADFKPCLRDAVGALTNVGDTTDIKENLDAMCIFFKSYGACFDKFQADCADAGTIFKAVINGVTYDYCSMTPEEQKNYINVYETGSASTVAVSVVAIITAIVALTIF